MRYSSIIIVILFLPLIAFGQTVQYAPLIEGGGLNTDNLGSYINSLYLLSISVAALLATIKLIIAGAKYMLSDVVTTQSEAKNEIQSSLLGLLLVVSAVLILTIINPRLITNELNITRVQPANPLSSSTPSQSQGAAATAAAGFSGNSCGASSIGPDPTDPQYEVIIEDYTLCPSQNMGSASTLARDCRQKPNGVFSEHGDKIVCRYPKQITTPKLPLWGSPVQNSNEFTVHCQTEFPGRDVSQCVIEVKKSCEPEPFFGTVRITNGSDATCSLPDVIGYTSNDRFNQIDCRGAGGKYIVGNGTQPQKAYCIGCLGLTSQCTYNP